MTKFKKKKSSNRGPKTTTKIYVHKRDGGKCFYCGGKSKTVDHLIPMAHGGGNGSDNLVACCEPCNHNRGTINYKLFKRYVSRFGKPKSNRWAQTTRRYQYRAMEKIWNNVNNPITFAHISTKRFSKKLVQQFISKKKIGKQHAHEKANLGLELPD